MLGGRQDMARRRGGWLGPIAGLLLLLAAGSRAESVTLSKEVGGNITMTPNYSGSFQDIRWLFNRDILADLEIEPTYSYIAYQLKDRVSIDNASGALTIRDLSKAQSGDYSAEMTLLNRTILYTDLKLNVLDRVSKPTIQNISTAERIILVCTSSTAAVSYEWLMENRETPVATRHTYNDSRPPEAVTLTCVVRNPVSEDRASITVLPIPEAGGLGAGGTAAIVIVVILIFLVLAVIAFRRFRSHRKNKTDEENIAKKADNAENVHKEENGGQEEQGLLDAERKETKIDEENDPLNVPVSTNQTEPFCLTLNISQDNIGGLQIKKNGSPLLEVGGRLEEAIAVRSQSLCMPDAKLRDLENYTAEVVFDDGRKATHRINVRDPSHVLDTKGAHEIIWKQEGEFLAKSFFPASQPFADDLVLRPGSVTISNLRTEYNGEYEVTAHYEGNASTTHEFSIHVMKSDNTKEANVLKIERRISQQPPQGRTREQLPIGSVTFHPSRIAEKYVWSRDAQYLFSTAQRRGGHTSQEGRMRIQWQTGDLTLQSLTPEDSGTYSLKTGDSAPPQEFTLQVQDRQCLPGAADSAPEDARVCDS